MNKLITTSTLGLAGLVATGLVAWQAPMAFGDDADDRRPSASGKAFKRDDDSQVLVTTVDDDDDDDTGLNHQHPDEHEHQHRHGNTNTNARHQHRHPHAWRQHGPQPQRQRPRPHLRRSGQRQRGPLAAPHQRRHPPQHPRPMSPLATWGFAEGDAITAELTAVRRLGGGSATRPTSRSTRSPTDPSS